MHLSVRVIPSASKTEIVGWMADGCLKIRLAAPPVDGEANRELVAFLAKILRVSKSDIEIAGGLASKKKTLRIPLKANDIETILDDMLGIKKQTPLF